MPFGDDDAGGGSSRQICPSSDAVGNDFADAAAGEVGPARPSRIYLSEPHHARYCWKSPTKSSTLCRRAAEANRACAARTGNVVSLTAANADDLMIVADLHGNRLNFERLLAIADLAGRPRRHLVMQEVCHGGPEYPEGGGCMSHLLLEDCIRLKAEFPERFHFLLSNHELAELGDFPICKSRRMLNLLFRTGIGELYGPAGDRVRSAYMEFPRHLPAGGAAGRRRVHQP